MESLHIPRKIHVTNWRQYARLVGHPPILDRFMTGGPMILLTGHYGNWELAGYLFGLFGYPTYSVARTLDNPYLDRFLLRIPGADRPEAIPKSGGYDQILEVLQSGQALSMLADQDAGQRGMFVEFFGRPASTHKAIALLAIEHQYCGRRRRASAPAFATGYSCCAEIIQPGEFTGSAEDARLLTQHAYLGPGRTDPPGPHAVSLAASAVDTSHNRGGHEQLFLKHPLDRHDLDGHVLAGKAAICLSSARIFSGVPWVLR